MRTIKNRIKQAPSGDEFGTFEQALKAAEYFAGLWHTTYDVFDYGEFFVIRTAHPSPSAVYNEHIRASSPAA